MKIKSLLISISIIFMYQAGFSQMSMWYMNGKIESIASFKIISGSESGTYLEYRNLKGKTKEVDLEELFKIDSAGVEAILYDPLLAGFETYNIDEMRSYIIGENEALKTQKTILHFGGGIVIGTVSAFLTPISLSIPAFQSLMYSPLIPGGYAAIVSITHPTIEEVKILYPDYANNENFINGYQDATKRKRGQKGLLGALIGIAAGFVIVSAIR